RHELDILPEASRVDLMDDARLAGEARAEVEIVELVEVEHAPVRQPIEQPFEHRPCRGVVVAVDPYQDGRRRLERLEERLIDRVLEVAPMHVGIAIALRLAPGGERLITSPKLPAHPVVAGRPLAITII